MSAYMLMRVRRETTTEVMYEQRAEIGPDGKANFEAFDWPVALGSYVVEYKLDAPEENWIDVTSDVFGMPVSEVQAPAIVVPNIWAARQ